jgi:hypothetical protein
MKKDMTKKKVTIRIIMSKYMMLLICAIVFVNGYSQETVSVTQNPDGSLHIQAVDFAYFNT